MVALFIMDSAGKQGANEEESIESESSWDKCKCGAIVGAAAVTGGTLMAITGGIYLYIQTTSIFSCHKIELELLSRFVDL